MIMSMIMMIMMMMVMLMPSMWQDLERVGGGGDLRERHSHSRFRSTSLNDHDGYHDVDDIVNIDDNDDIHDDGHDGYDDDEMMMIMDIMMNMKIVLGWMMVMIGFIFIHIL